MNKIIKDILGKKINLNKYKDLDKFTEDQQEEIIKGIKEGLTIEQYNKYIKPEFNKDQIKEIIKAITKLDLSEEEISLYMDPKLTSLQMKELTEGFVHGLTYAEIPSAIWWF